MADVNTEEVEKLLPSLLSVIDLKGLLGIAKDENKGISSDNEVQTTEEEQRKGEDKDNKRNLIQIFRDSKVETFIISSGD